MEKLLPSQRAADGGFALDGGLIDAPAFASADAALPGLAAMPLANEKLAARTLVAVGGISKFLKAHLGTAVITRDAIVKLRREVGAMTVGERVPVIQAGKSQKALEALGIETRAGALDYAVKLPASTTLLLRIMDGLGVTALEVSGTDARFALISTR
jgi:hypothetical protein